MNKLLLLCLFSISVLSCELAQLNEPTGLGGDGEMGEMTPVVEEPTTFPATLEDFEQAFHGGSALNWGAQLFTVAGMNGFQQCRLDDVMTINDDNTYSYSNGAIRCGGGDVPTRSGTWNVTDDLRNIVFDQGTADEYTVQVNGFADGVISLSGQYIGLAIRGIYSNQ
ncbi:hypothetical protein FNH22_21720 [Fulvivirga sp. M361]|uniref:hypothetical protein n=1 Tax=Fulvivirga sp. M361 TaxID=2594266 RepID=UPI00117BA544|nr:hypothetical protein [Fulvivirga sp. M361]TRX52670.1 hypothetical protein FNH22_21720 [Fulvivirga sp. M361]